MDIVLQDQMGVMADIVLVLTQGALTLCQGGSRVVPLLTSAHVQTLCSAWHFLFLSLSFAQLLGLLVAT